jgi:hypothetical protein
MDLVQTVNNAKAATADTLLLIAKPATEAETLTLQTVSSQRGWRFTGVAAQGVIQYNTNNVSAISARVSGRIERLYIKYNYQAVVRGQKLADIYSADLVNAQQELLFLKKQ